MKKILFLIITLISFGVMNSVIISTCQNLSSQGYYELDRNVNSTGSCFMINVSNVDLNCNGFSINHSFRGVDADSNVKDNITIRNCNIFDHSISDYGITLSDTTNSRIYNNNISNQYGAQDALGLWQSSNNVIENNYITKYLGSYDPLYLWTNSDNNTVRNNILVHLASDGISGTGLHIHNSNNNTIENNLIYTYNSSGSLSLRIHGNSEYNILRNNYAYSEFGIALTANSVGSINNLIYGNIANGTNLQVQDTSSSGNSFNNSIEGNFYANPLGNAFSQNSSCLDSDINGICDSSYLIPGSAGSIDYLPIAENNIPSIQVDISQLPIGEGNYISYLISEGSNSGINSGSQSASTLFPLFNIFSFFISLILFFFFF